MGTIRLIYCGTHYTKVGCVFLMVVVLTLLHAEFGRNDYEKDASHFIKSVKVGDGTVDHSFAYCHELYEEEVPDEIANIKISFILDGSA